MLVGVMLVTENSTVLFSSTALASAPFFLHVQHSGTGLNF